jgi:hypothetical protein
MWNGFRVALVGEPERQVIFTVDDPVVAGFAGEQGKLTDGDDARTCSATRRVIWLLPPA